MTEKIEKQILEISSMIDGVNIGIERIKEIRERVFLSERTVDFHDGVSFVTDTVLFKLIDDVKELKLAQIALRRKL